MIVLLRHLACWLMLLCFSNSVWASSTSSVLQYEAYIGVAKAGRMTVRVERQDDQYRVSGEARTQGLLERFKAFRAKFAAFGRMVLGRAKLEVYELHQKDVKKERLVTVRDGALTYVKNGRPRAARPALPGLDVLTALFVVADCSREQDVHTGRHAYHLQPLAKVDADAQSCHFQVTDDDDETFEMAVLYGEQDGLRVPIRIVADGVVSGRLQLVDSSHTVLPAIRAP